MRVVGLHGFLGQPSHWDGVRERVGEGVAWVTPSLPGHGVGAAKVEGAFEAVVDAWLGAVVEDGDWLVGYSMGARLALSYALRHPAKVAGAVLVSGSPGLATEGERAARRREDEAQAVRLERDGLAAFVEAWEALPLFASQRRLPEVVQAAHRAHRRGHDAGAVASSLRALGTGQMPWYGDAVKGAGVGLWLVTGAEDAKFVKLAAGMAEAAAVRGWRDVAGVGHDVVLEAPEAVAGVVRAAVGA